jgi:hypothetical protein
MKIFKQNIPTIAYFLMLSCFYYLLYAVFYWLNLGHLFTEFVLNLYTKTTVLDPQPYLITWHGRSAD